MDYLTLLEARQPLCKTIRWHKGVIDTSSYPRVLYFRRHKSKPLQTIEALSRCIHHLANHSRFALVHGEPLNTFPINEWVRRLYYSDGDYPATLGDRKTAVLIIDIDGLAVPDFDANKEPEPAIAFALKKIGEPFANTSCHWQFTASQQPIANRLYARLFFLLDCPLPLATIKEWAKTKQHDCCIDPALYSPAQLIYVASPRFVGLSDWIGKRNGLLRKCRDRLPSETLLTVTKKKNCPPKTALCGYTGISSNNTNEAISVDAFKDSSQGQYWLSLLGDHEGGDGFYPIIRSMTASAARYCGKSLNKSRLKEIVREHVWRSDSSRHSDDYLRSILTDRSLDNLINGAIRKFAQF